MYDDYHDYGNVNSQADIDKLVERNIEIVKGLKETLSDDGFLRTIACTFVLSKTQELQLIEKNKLIDDYDFQLGVLSGKVKTSHIGLDDLLQDLISTYKSTIAKSFSKGLDLAKFAQGRKGGKAKDAKTGNDIKRAKIRALWATGKYTSRDICAEQECAALDMSFSTARKALRGTPEPA
ncbi:MAG: hypothetical protein PHV02_21435 [Rhodocyclaceae bacterium]|nr:hypothetical protein [Rhodocyclaceae bacterium]